MLTEVHIAPLTALSWIGNNEVYKYFVPNGTKANVFVALPLDVRKGSAFPYDCSIHSEASPRNGA